MQMISVLSQQIPPFHQIPAACQQMIHRVPQMVSSCGRVLPVCGRIDPLRSHFVRCFGHVRRACARQGWGNHHGIRECSPQVSPSCHQVFVHCMTGDAERQAISAYDASSSRSILKTRRHIGGSAATAFDACFELGMFDLRLGGHPCVHLVFVAHTGQRASIMTIGGTGYVRCAADHHRPDEARDVRGADFHLSALDAGGAVKRHVLDDVVRIGEVVQHEQAAGGSVGQGGDLDDECVVGGERWAGGGRNARLR